MSELDFPDPVSRTKTWTYRLLVDGTIQSLILDMDNARVRRREGKVYEEAEGQWRTFATRGDAESACQQLCEQLETEGWYQVYHLWRDQDPNFIHETMVILPREQRASLLGSGTGDSSPRAQSPRVTLSVSETSSPGQLAMALYLAIIGENLDRVRQLVDAGANIQAGTGATWTHSPLAFALAVGHHEIADFLTRRGALFRKLAPEKARQIELLRAVEKGDTDTVRQLLADGADPGYIKGELTSQIDAAIEHGHLEILRRLLEAGADPNRTFEPALHTAASEQTPAMVALLADHGATLDHYDEDRASTPLGAAAQAGKRQAVEVLLAKGADPKKGSPLQKAGRSGHLQICALLWPHVDEKARDETLRLLRPKSRSRLLEILGA